MEHTVTRHSQKNAIPTLQLTFARKNLRALLMESQCSLRIPSTKIYVQNNLTQVKVTLAQSKFNLAKIKLNLVK